MKIVFKPLGVVSSNCFLRENRWSRFSLKKYVGFGFSGRKSTAACFSLSRYNWQQVNNKYWITGECSLV